MSNEMELSSLSLSWSAGNEEEDATLEHMQHVTATITPKSSPDDSKRVSCL